MKEVEIGKGRELRKGEDLAIVSIGHIGNYASKACELLEEEGISVGHYDARFVKPIDEELLHTVFKNYSRVITVEDGCIQGGFGSAVLEFAADNGYSSKITRLGIPDGIIEHGTQDELYHECGFDTEGIVNAAHKILQTELQIR